MSGRSQLQRALLDAATVLNSAANIARRAAVSIGAEGATEFGKKTEPDEIREDGRLNRRSQKTNSTLWPSQRIALQESPHASTSYRTDVPPSAPDGTLTEMKVVYSGLGHEKVNDERKGDEDPAEILRKLDESLKGYFQDPQEDFNSVGKNGSIKEASTREEGMKRESQDAEAEQAKRNATIETSQEYSEGMAESVSSDDSAKNASLDSTQHEEPRVTSSVETDSETSEPDSLDIEGDIASNERHSDSQTEFSNRLEKSQMKVNEDSTTSKIFDRPVASDPEPKISRPNDTRPIDEISTFEDYDATTENAANPLRAAKVPSSRIARLMHYGSLGAGLAWGAAGSFLGGSSGSASGESGNKQFMSDGNIRRLVDKLSTMRGAALKLGQFMSIQDSNLLPEQIEQVMLRVQNSANYMPAWQLESVMREDLGLQWRDSFATFNDVPFASASIGQVHIATLKEDHPSPLAGQKVAVKVQFPGVRDSIGSDLSSLRWLVSASALLPKGLFLDNTIRVMRRELDDECDYEREKNMCKRFGDLLNYKDSNFAVPRVVDDLCSKRVLTCEMMKGRPLTQASRYSQEKRNQIARAILELSLKELFTYRLMQTDPNWTNFLYNERSGKIELIDFGATREYDKEFMDNWLCMLRAAIGGERQECIHWSEKVGYLTGKETDEMRDAHVDSMIALGEPFRSNAPNPYPFAEQTITARVRAQIPLMLRQRLTPPPEPTYSLNRKLSGAFLLCARLKASIECRTMLEDVTKGYVLGNENRQSSSPGASSISSVGLGRRDYHTFRDSMAKREESREQKRHRLVNLAARWPRHIVEAVKEQEAQEKTPDGFTTLAPTPVSPSMTSVPSEPIIKIKPEEVDFQAKPSEGEKRSTIAESPVTAMDLAVNKGQTSRTIRGISVPRKPDPPGPEECCMSGCAHCTYDIYAESLMSYQEDLSKARNRLLALEIPLTDQEWDASLLGERPSTGQSHDSKEVAKRAQDEVDAVIGKLDPSMKAFLQLERSLKKSGKHATSSSNA